MDKQMILVTGATGKTGTQVVRQLLEAGWPVRAAVHRLDERSERLAQLGAEIIVTDLYDYEQTLAAMRGIKRAYFCPPVQPFMIQAAAVFATAAADAALEFIAQLSQWIASPAHPSIHTRQLWLVERMFARIPGIGHTVINPGVFADPLMGFIPGAANLGVYPNPIGDISNPAPSNEDIARVVVAVLVDPQPHVGKRYRPTSAASFSITNVAEAVGRELGRSVKVADMPEKMFLKAARAIRIDPFEAANTRYYFRERTAFGVNAPTQGLRELTGRDPETLETIVKRYVALPSARRSFSALLREVWTTIKIVFSRPFDAAKFERDGEYPMPPHPKLAGESDIWHCEHAEQLGPQPSEKRPATLPAEPARSAAS